MFRFDESIAGQTWVARALDVREFPPIESPWPVHLQSGRDPDYEVWLPELVGGEIAAAEQFIAASEALERAELPPPAPVPFPLTVHAPSSHVSYQLPVPGGGAPLSVFSGNRQRSYVLVVNVGAQDCFIAYGRDADAAQGLFLAAGGVGFHELIWGTTSGLSVACPNAAGTQIAIVDGSYDPPLPE